MGHTKESAKRLAEKMKAKYGDDFYSKIGKKGAASENHKTFADLSKEERHEMAVKGGKAGKGKKKRAQ